MKARLITSEPTTLFRKILTLGYHNWVTVWDVDKRIFNIRTITRGGEWTHLHIERKLMLPEFSLEILCSIKDCNNKSFPLIMGIIPLCKEHNEFVTTTCNDKGERE